MERSVVDPMLRRLCERVSEDIENRKEVLVKGSALTRNEAGFTDAETIALNYQKAVSHITALQEVIELALEIDRDRYGRKTVDGDD